MGTRLVLTLGIVAALTSATAAQMQSTGDTLSLDRAIALAVEHHPAMRAAEAAVRGASGALTQATSAYFPTLSATAGYTRTDGAFVFNPSFPPRQQSYNNYSTGIQLQQTLFDFGKTINRVSASSDMLDAQTFNAQSTRENVVMNVELAFFGIIQTQRVEQVNEEALQQAEEHLRQAKAFYNAGRRPLFDVTKAEVDVANANVNLIRARNQMRVANVQLENAIGVHPREKFIITDSLAVVPFPLGLDSAKTLANNQRPDIQAARAMVAASEAQLSATWGQHLPTLSATGSITWTNFDFPLFSRWIGGVTLSIPIFQGFSVVGQTEQARANADAAQANLDLLLESVRLEVEQTFLSLKEAEEQIDATTKLVQQAEENLHLAEKQYAAGVGTPIEVADAQLSLSNARITNIQALYDYNSALARLNKAIGNR